MFIVSIIWKVIKFELCGCRCRRCLRVRHERSVRYFYYFILYYYHIKAISLIQNTRTLYIVCTSALCKIEFKLINLYQKLIFASRQKMRLFDTDLYFYV